MANNAEWESKVTRRCGNLWGPFLQGAFGETSGRDCQLQIDVADSTVRFGDRRAIEVTG